MVVFVGDKPYLTGEEVLSAVGERLREGERGGRISYSVEKYFAENPPANIPGNNNLSGNENTPLFTLLASEIYPRKKDDDLVAQSVLTLKTNEKSKLTSKFLLVSPTLQSWVGLRPQS